jgi:hypothetical protein
MDAIQRFVRERPALSKLADILIAGNVRSDVILEALAAAAVLAKPVAFGGMRPPPADSNGAKWDRAMEKAMSNAGSVAQGYRR